jgi:hypothetical protein
VINVKGTNEDKLAAFADIMQHSASGIEGINELSKTLAYYKGLNSADVDSESGIEGRYQPGMRTKLLYRGYC